MTIPYGLVKYVLCYLDRDDYINVCHAFKIKNDIKCPCRICIYKRKKPSNRKITRRSYLEEVRDMKYQLIDTIDKLKDINNGFL